jgi:hypothetical protein
MLLECKHPHLKSMQIKRHNGAVRLIARALGKGPQGGGLLVVDAGNMLSTRAATEADVQGTRVPNWMLPNTPEEVRRKMRPDILLVDSISPEDLRYLAEVERGLPPSAANDGSLAPSGRTSTPRTSTYSPNGTEKIYLIEVGYCADTRSAAKWQEKLSQHAALTAALHTAGWKHVHCVPIVLGVGGSVYEWDIFSPSTYARTDLLHWNLIRKEQAPKLANKLHDHAVQWLHDIVCCRRALENPDRSAPKR